MSGKTARYEVNELWEIAPAQGTPAPDQQTPTERHLRVVPRPAKRASRWRDTHLFAGVTAALIIMVIFAVQLSLSIAVSEGAYESRALKIEERDLLRVERVLNQNVDKLASPQNLADNAAALGMVQNSNPATLRLSDNVVLGDLAQRTSEVQPNLVPNATLVNLPVVDAEGLMVARDGAAPVTVSNADPVAWEGALPAPETH